MLTIICGAKEERQLLKLLQLLPIVKFIFKLAFFLFGEKSQSANKVSIREV